MSLLMEKIFQYGFDELSWSENVTTNLRLSERQMPDIYNRLPPICKRLGIPVPELYVQMTPIVNAWTSGHSRPYIVLTLGLIRRIKDEELDAVLAHECGHILCEHVIYQTFANAVFFFWRVFHRFCCRHCRDCCNKTYQASLDFMVPCFRSVSRQDSLSHCVSRNIRSGISKIQPHSKVHR